MLPAPSPCGWIERLGVLDCSREDTFLHPGSDFSLPCQITPYGSPKIQPQERHVRSDTEDSPIRGGVLVVSRYHSAHCKQFVWFDQVEIQIHPRQLQRSGRSTLPEVSYLSIQPEFMYF
jgi:hypothetical protein